MLIDNVQETIAFSFCAILNVFVEASNGGDVLKTAKATNVMKYEALKHASASSIRLNSKHTCLLEKLKQVLKHLRNKMENFSMKTLKSQWDLSRFNIGIICSLIYFFLTSAVSTKHFFNNFLLLSRSIVFKQLANYHTFTFMSEGNNLFHCKIHWVGFNVLI